ncbi:MAG: hypothetical protein MUF87_03970 [Anaerolineae bacterium]|nr:hypothetical protein [Anaerolineae bacterium]
MGCQSSTPIPDMARQDASILANYLDLTAFPTSKAVLWQQYTMGTNTSNVPGPTDYYIVAILEFDQSTEPLLTSLGLAVERTGVYLAPSFIREWFPSEIINAFESDTDGNLVLQTTAYQALPILKSPFSYGYIFAVGNYLYIYGMTT